MAQMITFNVPSAPGPRGPGPNDGRQGDGANDRGRGLEQAHGLYFVDTRPGKHRKWAIEIVDFPIKNSGFSLVKKILKMAIEIVDFSH